MRKFELGDEVTVEFMGKVTEIKLDLDGKTIIYCVHGDNWQYAGALRENNIFALPQPKDFEVKNA
jgi:hypothetical protein